MIAIIDYDAGNIKSVEKALLYLGQEVYSMLFVRDNVANLMHIVGGLCGTAFGFLVGRNHASRSY